MLQVMAGPDEFDSTVSIKPVPAYSTKLVSAKKFSFSYFDQALHHPSLDPEIASSIKKQLGQLLADGHNVQPVNFDLLDFIVPAYYVLTTAEASSNLSRYDGYFCFKLRLL
jgi:aspartyl-tRNA(Asn)/glutamyl-tRNA(Gln) amidotransferase subunit A